MYQARTVLGIFLCVIIALKSSPKPAHKPKGPVLLDIYHPHLPRYQKVLRGHTADKQCNNKVPVPRPHVTLIWVSCKHIWTTCSNHPQHLWRRLMKVDFTFTASEFRQAHGRCRGWMLSKSFYCICHSLCSHGPPRCCCWEAPFRRS